MVSDVERWFASAPSCRCVSHPAREASSTCGRCGGFACVECLPPVGSGVCPPCVAALARERLPVLARSIAWKVLLVPLLAVGCVILVAGRSRSIPLEALATPWLLGWLVPLGCGLRLLKGPSVGAAVLGALSSLGLVAMGAVDALWWSAELGRYVDLYFLGVAPVVALAQAWELRRGAADLPLADYSG